jgi:GTP cyclohydrolase II
LDTIDANQHLGFGADERQYSAAVCMLEKLGISDLRLMTNNPLKIEALRQHGVNVRGRVPSPATVNAHNARYLETKRNRAGHLASCKVAR